MYYFNQSFKYENQDWYVLGLSNTNDRQPLYKWADKELISPEGKKNYWENIIKDDSGTIRLYAIPKDKIKEAEKALNFGEPDFIINNQAKKIRFLDSQLDEKEKIKNVTLKYTIDTKYFKDEATSYYFHS